MGAGASAGIAAAVKGSTPESLVGALDGLSEEDRIKLRTALNGQSANANAPTEPLPEAVAEALKEQFELFDLAGNGVIVFEESSVCLQVIAKGQSVMHDEAHIRSSFDKLDRRKCGEVSLQDWMDHYTELYNGKLSSQEAIDQAVARVTKMSRHLRAKTSLPEAVTTKLEELFKICDKDSKGFITVEEDKRITEAMGLEYDDSCKSHFRNRDGGEPRVHQKEWLSFFKVAILQSVVAKECTVDQAEQLVDQMREDLQKNLGS